MGAVLRGALDYLYFAQIPNPFSLCRASARSTKPACLEIRVWNGPFVKERLSQSSSSQTEMGASQLYNTLLLWQDPIPLFWGQAGSGSQMAWRIQTTDTTTILVVCDDEGSWADAAPRWVETSPCRRSGQKAPSVILQMKQMEGRTVPLKKRMKLKLVESVTH